METLSPTIPETDRAAEQSARDAVPFGANEMRLNTWEWLATILIAGSCMIALPRVWKQVETFAPGPDYRIPYALSNDYWLFRRRLDLLENPDRIPLIGDSVVWGEYVKPDGTLSHFLSKESGQPERFVNCGINGLYPLALEGIVKRYGGTLHDRKVILHCNLLWMSSPEADMSAGHRDQINHSRLLPQFFPKIPCYRADANERLSAVIEPHIGFMAWTTHLQNAYYDQRSIPKWTLEEDANDPLNLPNAWRNPIEPLKAGIPGEPADDPARGPSSRRHKPWSGDPQTFDWVDLERSLQWQAFGRLVRVLRENGNDVLVVVGPFNEHMIAEEQRPLYRAIRKSIPARREMDGVRVVLPEVLPSDLYADASHPLTNGYAELARRIYSDPQFRRWLERK